MDFKKPGGFSSSGEGGEGSSKDFTDPLKEELKSFWDVQKSEIENATDADVRGKHQFPLARIKKIMLEDKDVKMISSESLPLLSKACEFFIYELTRHGWLNTEQQGRRTLRQEDILEVIEQDPNNNLDFLIDEPCTEDKELHMENSAAQLQPSNYGPDPRTSIQMNHQRHPPPPPSPPPAARPLPPAGFHHHPLLPQYPPQPPRGPHHHPRQPPPHLRYAHPALPRRPFGTTLEPPPPPPPRPFPRPPPSC